MEITLERFYRLYIQMESMIVPNLSISEAAVYRHIFAHSVALGMPSCKASIRDVAYGENMSLTTVSRSIKSLVGKGCIETVNQPGPYSPGIYRILFPTDLCKREGREIRRKELSLYPALIDGSFKSNEYSGLIDILDKEDIDYLNLILKSLSPTKQVHFRNLATKKASGEVAEKKYKELVALSEFGPLRLQKYADKRKSTETD
jgi:DNA-binding MarR family transcriptional regulator